MEMKWHPIVNGDLSGWMDLCELCGERIDADGCKDGGW